MAETPSLFIYLFIMILFIWQFSFQNSFSLCSSLLHLLLISTTLRGELGLRVTWPRVTWQPSTAEWGLYLKSRPPSNTLITMLAWGFSGAFSKIGYLHWPCYFAGACFQEPLSGRDQRIWNWRIERVRGRGAVHGSQEPKDGAVFGKPSFVVQGTKPK